MENYKKNSESRSMSLAGVTAFLADIWKMLSSMCNQLPNPLSHSRPALSTIRECGTTPFCLSPSIAIADAEPSQAEVATDGDSTGVIRLHGSHITFTLCTHITFTLCTHMDFGSSTRRVDTLPIKVKIMEYQTLKQLANQLKSGPCRAFKTRFEAIINMKSPQNMKEVQRLTGRLALLSKKSMTLLPTPKKANHLPLGQELRRGIPRFQEIPFLTPSVGKANRRARPLFVPCSI
ncbi:hypothetical protein CR513_24310, partial [Mucuna pruriens]